jgi:hypothetical protein
MLWAQIRLELGRSLRPNGSTQIMPTFWVPLIINDMEKRLVNPNDMERSETRNKTKDGIGIPEIVEKLLIKCSSNLSHLMATNPPHVSFNINNKILFSF